MHRLSFPAFAAALGLALCLGPVGRASAQNVDLSTVPDRQQVQLTIYNAADLTLVRDRRVMSFRKGENPLQFSWANTKIDPTSVDIRFPGHEADLEVIDTQFPFDRPQLLRWRVESAIDGEAVVEITYFTSGISWQADYTCIASPDQSTVDIESFVRVLNDSGEDYENAQIRLVVGQINLVEQIARLANVPPGMLTPEDRRRAGQRVLAVATDRPFRADDGRASGAGGAAFGLQDRDEVEEQKDVAKEALGEYFIYTIEGTETVPTGWSKRLRSFDAQDVDIDVVYRYRPREYGEQLVRLYLFTNDEEHELGTTPLPDGVVRVYRRLDQGGLGYVGRHAIQYVAIGDKVELNLGPDPEVSFELIRRSVFRDELWAQLHGLDVFRKVDDGQVEIDVRSSIVGWNDNTVFAERIRNYTPRPIKVEIRRSYSRDVTFRAAFEVTQHDFNTAEFKTKLAPGEEQDMFYQVIQRQGRNAKQNRLEIERGPITMR